MLKNNRFDRKENFRLRFPYLIFPVLFVALSTCFSANIFGQVAVPLSDIFQEIEGKIVEIKGLDNRLFVGTTAGLWIADKDGNLIRQKEVIGGVIALRKFSSQIFVFTHAGLWRVAENGAPNQVTEVKDIINYGALENRFFIGTNEGLWIIGENEPVPYREIKGIVNQIEKFGERIFVSSENGSWIIAGNSQEPVRVEEIQAKINRIKSFGDRLFVNAENGSWIIGNEGKIFPVGEITGKVNFLESFGEQLFIGLGRESWIVGADGKIKRTDFNQKAAVMFAVFEDNLFVNAGESLWKIDKDGIASPINEINGRVSFIGTIGNRLFVMAKNGLWIIGNNRMTPVSEINARVNGVKPFGERFFVNTENGSWIIDKDYAVIPVKDVADKVNVLSVFGEKLLIGTGTGLLIIDSDGQKPQKIESIKGKVESISVTGKYIYVKVADGSEGKFYWVDPQLKIRTRFISNDSWAKFASNFLSSNYLPTGKIQPVGCYSYSDQNCDDPFNGTISKEFSFAKAEGGNIPSDNQFSVEEQFSREIVAGENELSYWVRDKWGNTFEQKAMYYGAPFEYLAYLVPLILWIAIILLLFALAPKYWLCHYLIISPWIRNPFSLWTIPLLLHLTRFRSHILRRYSAGVDKSDRFKDLKSGFAYPKLRFTPEYFRLKLEREKKLILVWGPCNGRVSYLEHLTAYYASNSKSLCSKQVFPVYISLKEKSDDSFESRIYGALANYGEISSEFASIFLERGGLYIFFDAVDETDDAGRQRLNSFLEKFGKGNYICLSSRQNLPEIKNVRQVSF